MFSDFIEFPPDDTILARLRTLGRGSAQLETLYAAIAQRLGSRIYDRSAAAFILIEMLYDFDDLGGDLVTFLPRSIMALTGDRDLADSAVSAFLEIKQAIDSSEATVAAEAAGATGNGDRGVPADVLVDAETLTYAEDVDGDRRPPSENGVRMSEEIQALTGKLQTAQKTLVELGLAARVSLELAQQRPRSRQRISRMLQDIASLRAGMRHFEELLTEAELQVLEAAGLRQR